ncbi:hypothetical protein B0H16DRAFT_1824059 [Mycena metata]|uniref:VWFA domain-containing protein n=1 Tax=Mycena metata TaxID=1033252 RepID=A0AAD7J5X6_9AGAR|nr:hypothetical protein B0H16DRAFT_1824059 [Mycena metata]
MSVPSDLPPRPPATRVLADLPPSRPAKIKTLPDLPPAQRSRTVTTRNRSWAPAQSGWGGSSAARSSAKRPDVPPPAPKYWTFSAASVTPSDISPRGPKGHTNVVIEAARIRSLDEQEMQNQLQAAQYDAAIQNTTPRLGVLAKPVDTDGPNGTACQHTISGPLPFDILRNYDDSYGGNDTSVFGMFLCNPYQSSVVSPFGPAWGRSYRPVPVASYHMTAIHQTIDLNRRLNDQAQRIVDAVEPKARIWDALPTDKKASSDVRKETFLSELRTIVSGKAQARAEAQVLIRTLAQSILDEEAGRWPDQTTRDIVANYRTKTGMVNKIKLLRDAQPIQYLHLLRVGYFEPIPVAWADQVSNPLKFSIEAGDHSGVARGTSGVRMKPDVISEMNMARDRMASAVEPPTEYFSSDDQCHVQHKTDSDGYSKQVLPKPFHAYDLPETPNDDTMILLDVSGSMDYDPVRPVYAKYLITGYEPSSQPRNKDVAKAIVRRFTDALAHHDHVSSGYDLITFSSDANFVGTVNHRNFEQVWRKIFIGGGTRVMTGWQKVKQRHFKKHRASATWHSQFGWQAGAETPILRLLLLLDGEATDMDEFELDLLGLSWAHVTIFLIGPDGHANELQRISDVNPHVSFIDAQGNTPERYVTHELLKRHLGVDLSLAEFREMEAVPGYSK